MQFVRTLTPGLFILILGLLFMWFGRGYPVGTVRSMGPGMFPLVLASLTVTAGVLIILGDFLRGAPERFDFRWRGVVAVLGALITFAVLLEPVGLLITGLIAVMILAVGGGRVRIVESLVVGIALGVAVWAVFGRALGMPVQLLPWGM